MKNNKGLTIIELLVYVGISALIVTASLTIIWTTIGDQNKSESSTLVNETGDLVLDRVGEFSKEADSIDSDTVFDTNKGKLILNYLNKPDITVEAYDTSVQLGGSSVSTTKLKVQSGGSLSKDIVPDEIKVKKFLLKDLSNSSSYSFKLVLTLERLNPLTKSYQAEQSWTTGFTLRAKK